MRIASLFLCCALAACSKAPRPTLPRMADSSIRPGGGNFESAEAVMFHTVYQYSGHANQALAFYAPEMEKRGARRVGDGYVDDNIEHTGGIGAEGSASAKNPAAPGVYLYVLELPEMTLVDVWENVPKSR
jgi:hypothetical protein